MEKAKKKQLKKVLAWVGLGLLVVLLTAMPLMAQAEVEEDGPVATVHSGTAARGSITTSLHGGGTLAADDAEDVAIPSSVKITEFLVKNGETVEEGAPLAAVDRVSVMTAIVSVTETMEYLQEEIEGSRNDTISSTISATAGGRIKKVFARSGESVQEVMLRDGCLALLSIDGLMAVKIERRMDITTGESVRVILADDTEVTGRVESNLDGVIIVTIDDEGYEIGQTVTVTTDDGGRIGSGTLYVHNAWKATAYSGTISTVYAKEERTVSSGASLFTLTDTDYTAQMEYLSSLHREYGELLQELFQMYESGTINAPCGGTISGVDKDSAHLLASEAIEGEQGWYVDLLSNETAAGETGWTIVMLSQAAPTCTGDAACQLPSDSDQHLPGCIGACDKSSSAGSCDANVHHSDCIASCDHADTSEGCNGTKYHYSDCIKGCTSEKTEGQCKSTKHYLTCIESCISSDGTRDCPATGEHKHSCIEDCVHADTTGICEATQYHYSDCIESCVNSQSSTGEVCGAAKHLSTCYYYGMTYKATAARIFSVGNELVVYTDLAAKEYTVERSGSGWKIVGETLNTDTLAGPEASIPAANLKDFQGKEGSIILIVTGTKGSETVSIGPVMYQAASAGTGSGLPSGMGGMDFSGLMGGMDLSAMMGGFSGFGNFSMGGSTTAETEENLFDLEGDVLLTVTPHETVSLTITLDERDIAKVSKGQTAEVKVEALKGQVFEAEVVEVGKSGTNSGGSSKFTAKLRLAMSPDMLDGMSASASLPLSTKTDILTIPAEALTEQGAKTVVYTALDEKGNPTSPVAVTTGVSDGILVEILSGLEEGDSFYYSYYDVLELDTSAEVSRYSF